MKKIKKKTFYGAIGMLLIGVLLGWLLFRTAPTTEDHSAHEHTQQENTIWTCSMHPQIRQPESGQCPLCGMDLIPVSNESSSNENPMEIKMSPTAMQLANVQTSVIEFQKPLKEVRMSGKVEADERNVFSQSAHIPGRVEKLFVNFTGESVSKGQVLAYIYSPDLVTAQEELFEAYKIKDNQPELYMAARGKLSNWKLTEMQIDEIIEVGTPKEQFPVLADVAGVVMNKRVNLGDYVRLGQSLFEIADLSSVWVLFDVYESDMQWVRKGDQTDFTIQSLPGEEFTGNITFVDPVINPITRVAKARLEMANPGMKLKPEMFAVGLVKSPIQDELEALIVPKSSVMWTGERSVVYVRQASASGVSFVMREVTIGAALGDSYMINEGLLEGEEIATNGTFSIDAAAQLAGKPSMMNPSGGVVMTGHNHGGATNAGNPTAQPQIEAITISKKAKEELYPLFTDYILLKDGLVADDFEHGKEMAESMLSTLTKVNMGAFTGEAHDVWMQHSSSLEKALKDVGRAENIDDVRKHFSPISDLLIMLAQTFGPFEQELYVQHCPMANENTGGNWISNQNIVQNPYFGQSMLKCGKVTEEIKQ